MSDIVHRSPVEQDRCQSSPTEMLNKAFRDAELALQNGQIKDREAALDNLYRSTKDSGVMSQINNLRVFKSYEIALLNSLSRHEEAAKKSLELVNYQDEIFSKLGASGVRNTLTSIFRAGNSWDTIGQFKLSSERITLIESIINKSEKLKPETKQELLTALYGSFSDVLATNREGSDIRGYLNGTRFGPKLKQLAEETGLGKLHEATRLLSLGYGEKAARHLHELVNEQDAKAPFEIVSRLGMAAIMRESGGRPEMLKTLITDLQTAVPLKPELQLEPITTLLTSHSCSISKAEYDVLVGRLGEILGRSPDKVEQLISEKQTGQLIDALKNIGIELGGVAFQALLMRTSGAQAQPRVNQKVRPKIFELEFPNESRVESLPQRRVANGGVLLNSEATQIQETSNTKNPNTKSHGIAVSATPGMNPPLRPPIKIPPLQPKVGNDGVRSSSSNRSGTTSTVVQDPIWRQLDEFIESQSAVKTGTHFNAKKVEQFYAKKLGGEAVPYGPIDLMGIDVVIPPETGKALGVKKIPLDEAQKHAAWAFRALAFSVAKTGNTNLSSELLYRARALEGAVSPTRFAELVGINPSAIADGNLYGLQIKSSASEAQKAVEGGLRNVIADTPSARRAEQLGKDDLIAAIRRGWRDNGYAYAPSF